MNLKPLKIVTYPQHTGKIFFATQEGNIFLGARRDNGTWRIIDPYYWMTKNFVVLQGGNRVNYSEKYATQEEVESFVNKIYTDFINSLFE